jgi:hypothetical protein
MGHVVFLFVSKRVFVGFCTFQKMMHTMTTTMSLYLFIRFKSSTCRACNGSSILANLGLSMIVWGAFKVIRRTWRELLKIRKWNA